MDEHARTNRRQQELGLFYGLLAYLWWGFIPAYFKLLTHVPPLLVLAHRVVWSFLFLAAVCVMLAPWRELRAAFRERRVLVLLSFSTTLLATNWGVYIWAVTNNLVLEGSFGYFINPLVTVALGVTLLKERLRPAQIVGLALALLGVIVLTYERGRLPSVALALAFSFAGYALVRKVAKVAPLVGLTVETALLVPVAIAFIVYSGRGSVHPFGGHTYGLLMLAGVVTAIPLLAFTAATRRLRLSTMGFLQYVGPTVQFLLAVFAYHEEFSAVHLVGFSCTWVALIIYSIDSWRAFARQPPLPSKTRASADDQCAVLTAEGDAVA